MRGYLGAALLGLAVVVGAAGGLWAYMKASGAEVDVCEGADCTSGWYPASALLVSALVLAALGAVALRRR